MKKVLIIIGLFSVLALGAKSQTILQDLYSNAASGVKPLDTITNTATVTMTSSAVKGSPIGTTVGVVFTKLTGTVAGTATLKGSLNGTDWFTASSTTYTVTDLATQSKSWELTGSPYLYFRVETVGSGTSTYTVKGQVLTRNPK